ncbi:UDP-GlcNAc:undecaprenyl-phosphate GlcNAc-1-phosphate transferase [Caldanaerobacter subterraneus subsp. tengcongensis MB4]|uniref:UDP-N-acetylmuramyl pentapeptide phosphotransferase/UDP-N-acetylglucosamine-1-phosphate transferase n=1 Tax=Caldanaerobacter subterraneus subsp. tengcongensis (strain DSM 15242 / JCM 11007 / NBRC 100824 / MB4) TaxID=273068 RepID=Q8RD92_CALS4|nr:MULTISPECIES: MraY family glycosyltransferase [Caldanaerobacter]MBE3578343.1 undecaprenyl/decaprenyl-phosphate alpha-N-acetylglucosaminyl 1-phosphate transferase [Caldanaerobacter subterraneus]AAM23455.1 UDP-N-acetylmuramyl pentapeptide phosphotransferase/UDP-N- acetylglucosamine-1-phosphate transferase [Caldanaerobacter subterraneus subsp. tengcongensis MB4]MCS3917066.1 UDP-GlcNAc:undecaprenyl-phosphate GlcNAc-1-phosphate transferase [Caldanaerobacter subterraneus subsp. tengcongensis MB4]M
MKIYFLSFILAFAMSFVTTPLVKKLAFAIGAIDVPDDKRRIHTKPIPRLGGLAIFAGTMASLLLLLPKSHETIGIILGSLVIVLLGVLDDKYTLSAKVKLVGQIAAALILILSGIRIDWISNPFGSGVIYLKSWVAISLTLLWVVGVTNTINLIDGLDGLAAGIAFISSTSLFIISLLNGRYATAVISIAIAGASLGFLPYNFNPAKIFMGDTGAMFLGFLLSAISIQGAIKSATAIAIVVPVLVLGVPIFDTLFAIIRRILNKRPIMEADRGHLHHRLLDKGLNQKQVVFILYGVSLVLGVSAILISFVSELKSLVILAVSLLFILWGANKIELLRSNKKGTQTR